MIASAPGLRGTSPARRVNRATAVLAGKDCARQFKAAWERFAADEANLVEFLNAKRQRR